MSPDTVTQLQELTQHLARISKTQPMPAREAVFGVVPLLQGMMKHGMAAEANRVIMADGQPVAALLGYETYETLLHIARLVTFELTEGDSHEVGAG